MLSFHFVSGFLCCAKVLNLIRSHLFIFAFISFSLRAGSKKILDKLDNIFLPHFNHAHFFQNSLELRYFLLQSQNTGMHYLLPTEIGNLAF